MTFGRRPNKTLLLLSFTLLAFTLGLPGDCRSQSLLETRDESGTLSVSKPVENDANKSEPSRQTQPEFRVECVSIPNGAELLTIFAKVHGNGVTNEEIPLLSVARDTLGDDSPENDRLRYIWMLTYTEPTLRQRLGAVIPFFYKRIDNKTNSSKDPPPMLVNISSTSRRAWQRMFWLALQNLVIDKQGIVLRSTTRTFSRNRSDYRAAHLTQAFSFLSIYERIPDRQPKNRQQPQ